MALQTDFRFNIAFKTAMQNRLWYRLLYRLMLALDTGKMTVDFTANNCCAVLKLNFYL